MKQYTDAVSLIMDRGRFHPDRTGTGTWKLFGLQMRFDLAEGFPMVTEKFVPFKSMVTELLWMISGSTNVKWLQVRGCTIWDEWALPDTKTVEKTAEELNRELGAHMNPPREFGLEPKTGDELAGVFTDTMEAFVESIKTKATEAGISLTKEIQVADGGELGPVYGKQWRNWATGQQRPLSLVERVKIYNERAAEVGRRSLEESIQISDGNGGYYTEFSNLPAGGREEKALHDHLSMSGIPETTERLVDQLKELIENLKAKPYSRRHLVSAWNVADLPDESVSPQENAANGRAALASCHAFFQFNVERLLPHEIVKLYQGTVHEAPLWLVNWYSDNWEEEVKKLGLMTQRLSCQLYQRSADMFLGVPFNIASYSLLTMMVAQVANMLPGDFIWTGGDCHVYSNHKEQVEQMLANPARVLPHVVINSEVKDLFAFTPEDFELVGYHHGGVIKAPVAV